MAAGTVSEPAGAGGARVRVSLLGPFTIKRGGRGAGPWYRPPAKRLCELVMVSPGLRVGRELAQEMLFADLGPSAAANALSRALSLARGALSPLGGEVRGLLQADRAHIWASPDVPLDIDLVAHEAALRTALAMERGLFGTRLYVRHWPTMASCSKTSPTPTGRSGPERPSSSCAKEPVQSWPGTAARATGAPLPRRSSKPGKPAWPTMRRQKRRLHR